jgi:hypothetical protein
MTDGAPTLKVIVAWSDSRHLCTTVRDAVVELAGEQEVRAFGEDALVVYTPLTAADLRDRLCQRVAENEGLFVAEFETWSGHGTSVDARWLLARGH